MANILLIFIAWICLPGYCLSQLCPKNMFIYLNLCLHHVECVSLPAPINRLDATWKGINGKCVMDCPPGFQEQRVRYSSTFSYSKCIPYKGMANGSEAPTTLLYSPVVTSVPITKTTDALDKISGIIIDSTNSTASSIKISCDELLCNSNDLIVLYQLEYKRTDLSHPEVKREYIRRKDLVDSNGTVVLSDLSPGSYCIQVRAISLAGPAGPFTNDICFNIKEAPSSLSGGGIAGISLFVLFILIVLVAMGVYHYMKLKKKREINESVTISVNPVYDSVPNN